MRLVMVNHVVTRYGHFELLLLLKLLLLPICVLCDENNTSPAGYQLADERFVLTDSFNPEVPVEVTDDNWAGFSDKIVRSTRAKYDATWMGLGKREPEARPSKFGQKYKWIGLGKREARQKYGSNYKFIGLGKRATETAIKFNPEYKWISLGKRDTKAVRKFNPSYKWIGIGKRMTPYFTSQLLNDWLENEQRYRNMEPTIATDPWISEYSAITKKYMDDSDADSTEEKSPFSGRPNVRGGYQPIYRYVGLG